MDLARDLKEACRNVCFGQYARFADCLFSNSSDLYIHNVQTLKSISYLSM